jgi:hypothetical protein
MWLKTLMVAPHFSTVAPTPYPFKAIARCIAKPWQCNKRLMTNITSTAASLREFVTGNNLPRIVAHRCIIDASPVHSRPASCLTALNPDMRSRAHLPCSAPPRTLSRPVHRCRPNQTCETRRGYPAGNQSHRGNNRSQSVAERS